MTDDERLESGQVVYLERRLNGKWLRARSVWLEDYIGGLLKEMRAETAQLHEDIDSRAAHQRLLQRERDEARAENAAWRKATGRDDPEALDSYLGRAGLDAHLKVLTELMTKAEAQRDEARAELAFIKAEYAKANASDLTRDALAMQNAVLRADLESVDSDDRIAARRWQAEAMQAHEELAKARAEIKRLRWDREAGCENTPTKDCECPGCCTARERAERGEA